MMTSNTWIDIGGHRDAVLQEHLRGYWALENLSQPDIQTPQVLALFGSHTKRRVVRHLFQLQSGTPDKIVLHGISGLKGSSPLFLADCELHNARSSTTSNCGTVIQHALLWYRSVLKSPDLVSIANLAYSQIVLPFSTVCGIFANDYGGIEPVAFTITHWMRALRFRSSEVPSDTFSKVLVFVEQEDQSGFDEKLATTEFIIHLRQLLKKEKELFKYLDLQHLTNAEFEKLLSEQYFEIKIIPLPTVTRGEVRKQLDTLKNRITQESQDVHNLRKAAKLAFNARHLKGLFGLACTHFSRNLISPFSFIRASRVANPVPEYFQSGISELILAVPEQSRRIIAPIVASSLRLDNFPPGSHAFNLTSCYEVLYSEMLTMVLRKESMLYLENDIKKKFSADAGYLNSAFSHLQTLRDYAAEWKNIHSTTCCFACLGRLPKVMLECKHHICEKCVVIHGKSNIEEPWNITLESCPLCMSSTIITISLKPDTAGVRALAIDGGSKLDFDVLNLIEKALALPMGIEKHFDIAHASGEGVWELIKRFCKIDQTPEDTHKLQKINRALYQHINPPVSRFSEPTRIAFKKEFKPTLKRINGALKTFPRWGETMQASMVVISSLATVFDGKRLLQAGGDHKIGILVAKPKTTLTHVLSNYQCSKHETSEKSRDIGHRSPTLAQCARMSLLQKSVQGYQTLRCHNPKEIINTIHEAQDGIWKRGNRTTDVIIAIGAHTPLYDQARGNITYPNLIDYRVGFQSNRLADSCDMILASLFYIELIGMPQPNELQQFSCKLQVRCRLPPSSPAYSTLVDRLRQKRARFYFDYQSIPCINHELYDESRRGIAFSRRVDMSIQAMCEVIDVKIDGVTSSCCSISNCPYKLEQLVKDQKLDCIFGNDDHKLRYFGSLPSTDAI